METTVSLRGRVAAMSCFSVVFDPIAGHAMGPPGIGTNLSLGGTLSADA